MSSTTAAELFNETTIMYLQYMVKAMDARGEPDSAKEFYLKRVRAWCEKASRTKTYDLPPHAGAAQDGWLLLKDAYGHKHQVPYRGCWTIENLKDYIEATHQIPPDTQHLTVVTESFTSPE